MSVPPLAINTHLAATAPDVPDSPDSPFSPPSSTVTLLNPMEPTTHQGYTHLNASATDAQKVLLDEVLYQSTSQPIYLHICEAIHLIVPSHLLAEDDAHTVVPSAFVYEFIDRLKQNKDPWFQDCWKKDPHFITLDLGIFIFSYGFDFLRRFLKKIPNVTLSFSAVMRAYLERDQNFETTDFVYDYRFLHFAIQHKGKVEVEELELLIQHIKEVLVLRNRASLRGSLTPAMEQVFLSSIEYRLLHPKATHREIRIALSDLPFGDIKPGIKYSPAGEELFREFIVGQSDMVFAYNFRILNDPFFEFEICPLLSQLRHYFPQMSHFDAITVVGFYMQSQDRRLLLKDVRTEATQLYKTWWFTQRFHSSRTTSLYDLALEWHVHDLLFDRKGRHLAAKDCLHILQKEMEEHYPLFPFNSFRALSLVMSAQKKRVSGMEFKMELFVEKAKAIMVLQGPLSKIHYYLLGKEAGRVIGCLISFSLHQPLVTFRQAIQRLTPFLSDAPKLVKEGWIDIFIGMGDMIFAYNEKVREKKLFNEVIIPICTDSHERIVKLGHKNVVNLIVARLRNFSAYKNFSPESLGRVALHYYKTWWYSTRPSHTPTYYEEALEWEAIALMIDDQPDLYNHSIIMEELEKRMTARYPNYPFNRAHAHGFTSQILSKKVEGIYEEVIHATFRLDPKYNPTSDDIAGLLNALYPRVPFDKSLIGKILSQRKPIHGASAKK